MVPWTGWRGPERNALVAWLPRELPAKANFLWTKELDNQGLGGVAADEKRVYVVDRDAGDTSDIFRCLDAATGKELWTHSYLATGNLDYGNSPRATPLLHGKHVFLFGAFGHLTCAQRETGDVLWTKNIREEFGADDELKWGTASSPLIVDGKLIVNPGGPKASLVALDPKTGDLIWRTPGNPAAYASFLHATLGGKSQLVGYDNETLGGWDVATGKRLWKLIPEAAKDFNVPTPLVWHGKLVVCTENNGTRVFAFDDQGKIIDKPLAFHEELAPDTHSPVIVGDRLFGAWQGMFCLSLTNGLKPIWKSEELLFLDYTTLIASPERLLVTGQRGELVLIDARADEFRVLSRLKVFPNEQVSYSHPALVGSRLYVRGSNQIVCLELNPGAK